jgi:hypothetical protein
MRTKKIIEQLQRRLDHLTDYVANTNAKEYAGRVQYAKSEIIALRSSIAMWERVMDRRQRVLAEGVSCRVSWAIDIVAAESVGEPGWDDCKDNKQE